MSREGTKKDKRPSRRRNNLTIDLEAEDDHPIASKVEEDRWWEKQYIRPPPGHLGVHSCCNKSSAGSKSTEFGQTSDRRLASAPTRNGSVVSITFDQHPSNDQSTQVVDDVCTRRDSLQCNGNKVLSPPSDEGRRNANNDDSKHGSKGLSKMSSPSDRTKYPIRQLKTVCSGNSASPTLPSLKTTLQVCGRNMKAPTLSVDLNDNKNTNYDKTTPSHIEKKQRIERNPSKPEPNHVSKKFKL